jgi:hypothetical protein
MLGWAAFGWHRQCPAKKLELVGDHGQERRGDIDVEVPHRIDPKLALRCVLRDLLGQFGIGFGIELGDTDQQRHLNKRDGTPVSVPVWCAADNGSLLVFSEADSWKVRRIRRDAHVRLAPCSARGRPRGPAVDADASLVEDIRRV